MHETLIDNVLGYIDNHKIDNTNTYIRGWCFHKTIGVLQMRLNYDGILDHKEETFSLEKRNDVAKYYKNDNIEACGWSIKIETPEILEKLELEVKINDKWERPFNFIFYDTNKNSIPSFIVVDNFYKQPDKVREYAMKQNFSEHPQYHKGKRTDIPYRFPNLKSRFESILGYKIKNWTHYGVNCSFQSCIAGDQIVYHIDTQQYAGIIFLTPDSPPESGTTFYRSKITKNMKIENNDYNSVFRRGFYDSSQFEIVDVVGNLYNRLVLFDAQMIHAASNYFGNDLINGRLFQMFFFDLEESS
jgi:hypothetical protein